MSILPKIDPTLLPDLVNLVGTFGSGRTTNPGFDDRIVIIATIVYETNPGGGII